MKTVYFVRHGESETNAGPIFLGPSAALTERGKKQTYCIAERASKLPVDTIVASTMRRAVETGDIIAQRISKPIQYSDLFTERLHPTSHNGLSKTHPECAREEQEFLERFTDPLWKFEDGENFVDLKKRADSALRFLEELTEDNILVASHGVFMTILLARVVHGEDLTAAECIRCIRGVYMDNTGLSILRYDPEKSDSWMLPWHVRVWNDHSHLADI
jgi:probable phosphoglycerate mutase